MADTKPQPETDEDQPQGQPQGNPLAEEYGLSPEQTKMFDLYL